MAHKVQKLENNKQIQNDETRAYIKNIKKSFTFNKCNVNANL